MTDEMKVIPQQPEAVAAFRVPTSDTLIVSTQPLPNPGTLKSVVFAPPIGERWELQSLMIYWANSGVALTREYDVQFQDRSGNYTNIPIYSVASQQCVAQGNTATGFNSFSVGNNVMIGFVLPISALEYGTSLVVYRTNSDAGDGNNGGRSVQLIYRRIIIPRS
jgi:hypothetical protein